MTSPVEKEQENKQDIPANQEMEQATDTTTESSRISELEAELAALKDKMLRAAADAENTRKRAQRDVTETTKYAVSGLAKDLIEVAENLGRALDSVPEDKRADHPLLKVLCDGVEMTFKELVAAFEKHGIRRVNPIGEKFDHNFHQAMMQVPSTDKEPGYVVQVLQAGYVIHDRLLRPAMVGVSIALDDSKEGKHVDTTV